MDPDNNDKHKQTLLIMLSENETGKIIMNTI